MNHDRIMSYARRHKAIIPTQGSQRHQLLSAMFDGMKFTVLTGLKQKHCMSVSQRMSELKRDGWPVTSRWVKLKSGKRVKEYSL